MRQLRCNDFLKIVRKKYKHLNIAHAKGSEIKIHGKALDGIYRMHIMGCHGKNPTFSKAKIMAFLYKFGISPTEFFN